MTTVPFCRFRPDADDPKARICVEDDPVLSGLITIADQRMTSSSASARVVRTTGVHLTTAEAVWVRDTLTDLLAERAELLDAAPFAAAREADDVR